jgi:hypothetical protein
MIPDDASLPYHHAGAMINKEMTADMGPGMDIDSGDIMGIFGHHPGNQGHSLVKKFMGGPISQNSQDARIAKDNFIKALGRWIPLQGGPNIIGQDFSKSRQLFKEMDGFLLPPILTQGADLLIAPAFMADAEGNLPGEEFEKGVYFNPDLVREVKPIDFVVSEIAREKTLS